MSAQLRVAWSAPVQVTVDGQLHMLPALDLRPTGIALQRFPVTPDERPISLRFCFGGRDFELEARVARRWEQDGREMAGLAFLNLGADEQRFITRTIVALTESGKLTSTPAGDPSWMPPIARTATAKPRKSDPIRRYRELLARAAEKPFSDCPPWIAALAADLTAAERDVLAERTHPVWADEALRLRLMLARYRRRRPGGALTPRLAEQVEATRVLLSDLARSDSPHAPEAARLEDRLLVAATGDDLDAPLASGFVFGGSAADKELEPPERTTSLPAPPAETPAAPAPPRPQSRDRTARFVLASRRERAARRYAIVLMLMLLPAVGLYFGLAPGDSSVFEGESPIADVAQLRAQEGLVVADVGASFYALSATARAARAEALRAQLRGQRVPVDVLVFRHDERPIYLLHHQQVFDLEARNRSGE